MEILPTSKAIEPLIRRNTLLLFGSMAALNGMLQLTVAISTITLTAVTGTHALAGVAPAIFLMVGALAALPGGRAMDRVGRMPVLRAGFAMGLAGSLLTALGTYRRLLPAVVLGVALVGAAAGLGRLSRTAAADMYPGKRRARGVGLVLFGAVLGAILGPLVFMPLFGHADADVHALVLGWLAAAGFMLVGLALVWSVRPDPRAIAHALGAGASPEAPSVPPAALAVMLRRRGVVPALLSALASFGIMTSVMNLSGLMMVMHGHDEASIFPVLSAHIVGMYGLVIVVGDLVDRSGRKPALVAGLVLVAVSTLLLLWASSLLATALSLFLLGLGWNISFVAATAQLADLSLPSERGRLLGFNDLLSGLLGASLALIGGVALDALGDVAVDVGATAVAIAPALWIAATMRRQSQLIPRTT